MSASQKVLLVRPYRNNDTMSLMPPLGMTYLAGYLRRRGDVDVRIIDMAPAKIRYEEVPDRIRDFRPDWVGISALTFESDGMHKLAAIIKERHPDLPVVVGGPHPSAYVTQVMEDTHIDYAVIGEGEVTADELSAALRNGGPVEKIDGLAWRDGGNVRINPRQRYIEDLDALPFPAWDLIDIPAYKRFDRMSRSGVGDYMVLFTTRACPYKCLYCHKMFGKGLRKRSPENVLAEIRSLHDQYGVREFEIIDDIFNLDLPRAKQIFDMIADSGMKLRLTFPNGVRGDRLDEEFFVKARRAGVVFMAFAVETATPRLQKMLRKNINLERIERNIVLARKHGIFCLGFFMLGFPSETREEIQATVDFAVRSKLHAAHLFIVNAYEGTEMAELAESMGKPVFSRFDNNYLSEGFTNLTDLPDKELDRIRRNGLIRFWLKPSRVWSIVRDYPCKSQLPYLVTILVKRLLLKV
ncbi:MAG: cobalamin-dependent protein [Phycisphaerae bacterium]|nr:cobalamin-dependent protein [Phycisphaerae bacterium]